MRTRTGACVGLTLLIVAVLAGVAASDARTPPSHQSTRPAPKPSLATCSDTSTACLDAVVMSYINAIGTKSPALAQAVRAAPNVQRWEDGLHNVTSRAQLVAELESTQKLTADIRDVRLFPARSGHDVFAMYLVDGGLNHQLSITSHVIERFGISQGLIQQIEVVQCAGGPGEVAMGTPTDLTGDLDLALCVRANPAIPAIPARSRARR